MLQPVNFSVKNGVNLAKSPSYRYNTLDGERLENFAWNFCIFLQNDGDWDFEFPF